MAHALLTTLFLSAGGCQLLLDFDDPGTPEGDPIDAAPLPPGDAGPDLYEPNDSPQTAIELPPGSYDLSIAPVGDEDYWQFVLTDETDVAIGLRFTDAADLDLELYSISDLESPLAWSRGTDAREEIVRAAAENEALGPGVFLIRVFAFNGEGMTNYELSLSLP